MPGHISRSPFSLDGLQICGCAYRLARDEPEVFALCSTIRSCILVFGRIRPQYCRSLVEAYVTREGCTLHSQQGSVLYLVMCRAWGTVHMGSVAFTALSRTRYYTECGAREERYVGLENRYLRTVCTVQSLPAGNKPERLSSTPCTVIINGIVSHYPSRR